MPTRGVFSQEIPVAAATSVLLKLLSAMPRLDYLTIRGTRSYAEDDLINLVSTHATTLTRFALKGPSLVSGTWTSTIRRLLDL
jgi:hypothetical protein